MIKLRAAKGTDVLRLKEIWHESFSEPDMDCDFFFEHCFTPDHVETSLLLLEDEVPQSMVFFLPTFWYDDADRYGPLPCLYGLATAKNRRHRKYAGWLVETACDFLTEKGAAGVWTDLSNPELELFFTMQGFWSLPARKRCALEKAALPAAAAVARRIDAEKYAAVREEILRGENHVVDMGAMSELWRERAEVHGGGLFAVSGLNSPCCAMAQRQGDTVTVLELLCADGEEARALAALAELLPGTRYCAELSQTDPDGDAFGGGMIRLMNGFAKMGRPDGYLGRGLF